MAQSKYCYPNTNVLMNKFGVKNQEHLSILERNVTNLSLYELLKNPIVGKFDLKHLQEIHKHIFKDIYEFAGHIREENIAKGFVFASYPYIKDQFHELHLALKKDNYLKNLDVNAFSDKAADYMAEINVLHPFREGNGRATREYIRTLGFQAGYELDFSRVGKDRFLEASIKSTNNPKDLANVINDCILNEQPNKEMMKIFKSLGKELER